MKYYLLPFLLFNGILASGQVKPSLFSDELLITTGVYYYPEHWDSLQWERDIRNMAEMGFEFTHYAEFAWAQLEPEEGQYNLGWLDRVVFLAARYKLKVILCTPTATPPVWLVRSHPEVLGIDENGQRDDHGSRQHGSYSSNYYRKYALTIVEILASRYGNNSAVIGWQLDNEPRAFYDYSGDAQLRFRDWLKKRYGTIGNLNKAWGTAFWSQEYTDFEQINIPLRSRWGMNPHQTMDHNRFVAAETAGFLDEQARIIRQFSGSRQWITSNYIPNYSEGYIGASHELDFITYTKYMVSGNALGIGPKGYRIGDPLSIAMSNDFFRPLSPTYGVMELQPGQVNWGRVNSQPAPGAVRLWLWHVFAGGGELACTYRYRAPLYGYELYHYGIVGYDGVTPTPGGLEYKKFMEEIRMIRTYARPGAPVPKAYSDLRTGILFNVDNLWAMEHNKQNFQWNTLGHFEKYYKPLKSFGAPVDFIRDTFDFSDYTLIIVPAYQQIDKSLIEKMSRYAREGGHLVLTCRTGHQNRQGHLWEAKFAEPIYDLIGAEIEFYDLLIPQAPDTVEMGTGKYPWTTWGEILKPLPGTETWAVYRGDFYSGKPAVISRKLGKGSVTYVGVDSESGHLEKELLKKVFAQMKLTLKNYPDGFMVEYRDGLGIAVNYSDKPYPLQLAGEDKILAGNKILLPADVCVWTTGH
jgi:beta-galactosidase